MPALWITASNRPSLLTASATVLAPAPVERSPETAPQAPVDAARASRLRSSFRLNQELRRHETEAVRGSCDKYACHFSASSYRVPLGYALLLTGSASS